MLVSRSTVVYRKILYNPNFYRRLADKPDPKAALQQATNALQQNPFVTQLVAGSCAGCLTGYVVKGVGRTAFMLTGTGIIAYEIAKYKKLIPENMDPKKIAGDVGNKYGSQSSEYMTKIKAFASKNRVFTAAFVGGFLIGVVL